MAKGELIEGGVYSLALTPYQYVAHRVQHEHVSWVLEPTHVDIPRISAPPAYLTHDGSMGIKGGITEYTREDLDFTGRIV